jgi:hypothetical protein
MEEGFRLKFYSFILFFTYLVYFVIRFQTFKHFTKDLEDTEDIFIGVVPTLLTCFWTEKCGQYPSKNMPFVWSEEREELLIEMWKDRENLYNVNLPSYHNKHSKQKSLEEIMNALGCNCKFLCRSVY